MMLRDRIRQWLGLDVIHEKVELIRLYAVDNDKKQAARYIELTSTLSAINKRMINEHIGGPREFTAQVLDWETVQAIVLAELERNPQKEN
jgi:hypothetical protein